MLGGGGKGGGRAQWPSAENSNVVVALLLFCECRASSAQTSALSFFASCGSSSGHYTVAAWTDSVLRAWVPLSASVCTCVESEIGVPSFSVLASPLQTLQRTTDAGNHVMTRAVNVLIFHG